MYETTFGTDWVELAREEAIERAFALGVLASCHRGRPEEYERVRDAVATAYDRSMVELAYAEGRQKAAKLRRDVDDDDAVWSELVEDESAVVRGSAGGTDRPRPGKFDLPPVLSRTSLVNRRRTDERERLRLPSFLRR